MGIKKSKCVFKRNFDRLGFSELLRWISQLLRMFINGTTYDMKNGFDKYFLALSLIYNELFNTS